MWEARADYADGTSYCGCFDDNPYISDRDMEYNLECMLIERHKECIWYSVSYVMED